MATPKDLTVGMIPDIGSKWMGCLDPKSPFCDAAWLGLNKRGYSKKKDAKGNLTGVDHHAEGKALFDKFIASTKSRGGAKPTRQTSTEVETAEAKALREWVRGMHNDIGAVYDKTKAGALHNLPTLSELKTQDGLQTAAGDFVSLLSNENALKALADYGITADDGKTGETLMAAWTKSRSGSSLARGGEEGKTSDNIADREAFVAWLTVWWKLAKRQFKNQPEVLTALGVITGSLRRAKAKPDGGDGDPKQG